MLFDLFPEHRRRKIIEQPFKEEWLNILHKNVPVYEMLNEEEQNRLRDDLRIFHAEKNWEGCGGQEMTDEISVTISAQACVLTLNRKHNFFENVESILVYPSAYRAPERRIVGPGVVQNTYSDRAGEAWSNGPIVLSWDDVRKGGGNPKDGSNVVYHEFAHKLDMGDEEMNGVPLLNEESQVLEWAEVMKAEFEELTESIELGHPTLIDPYGATNPAEFFAVTTECFFEKPVQLRHRHPQLYALLQNYYQQDTAARFEKEHHNDEAEDIDRHHNQD